MIFKSQYSNLILALALVSLLSSCVICRYRLKPNSISTCKEACALPYQLEVESFKKSKPYEYNVVKVFKTTGDSRMVKFKSTKKTKCIWDEYKIVDGKEQMHKSYDKIPFKLNTWYKIDNLYGGSSLIVTNPDKVKYFFYNQ